MRPCMQAFFIAPRDGNYTFHVSCDDQCRLNGTYQLVGISSGRPHLPAWLRVLRTALRAYLPHY